MVITGRVATPQPLVSWPTRPGGLGEYGRKAEDEHMLVMGQAKAARIPVEYPVVAVDQVDGRPDQGVSPHGPVKSGVPLSRATS
jgi:hypothetical protein